MAWLPIANTVPQYHVTGIPASGYVLKFYQDSTTTNIMLATDNTGGTQATDVVLNAEGFPEISGNVIIPHLEEAYKIALYPTQAAADADSGATWTIDNIINTDVMHLSGTETVTGDKTFTGAFTSLGIDDNATGERVEISDAGISYGDGTAGEVYTHQIRGVTTGQHIFVGGNLSTDGGALNVYGSTNSSRPGDITLQSQGLNFFVWDESAGTQEFKDGSGAKTRWLITDGSQVATFANPPVGLYAAAITGHIRAGNIQLVDGDTTVSSVIVTSVVTVDTWESVGPTGSGADNIWTAMDNIPSNATVLLVNILARVSPSSAATATLSVYATEGDVVSPTNNFNNNGVAFIDNDQDAASGIDAHVTRAEIPLGATNQDFNIYWEVANQTTNGIILYYRGFMTD